MKIKKILRRNRRDFSALVECEHCGSERKIDGCYDDSFYHQSVIPKFKCKSCGKSAGDDYVPQKTKYPDSQVV